MIYRNKTTGNTVKANGYAEEFAFSHNSNYELVTKEEIKTAKPKSEKPENDKPKANKPKVNNKATANKPKVNNKATAKSKEEAKDTEPKTGAEVIKDLLEGKN